MWKQLKLILITLVLTALIWVFADQADRRETTVTVTLRLVLEPNSDLVPILVEPRTRQVRVRVRGTNKALQNLGISESRAIEVEWPISGDVSLGKSVQILRPILARSSGFAGVSVLEVHPEQAELHVDRYVSRELPIRPEVGTHLVSGDVRVVPSKAQVRILESEWNQTPIEAQQLVVPLDRYLRGKAQGRLLRFDVTLPVQIAGNPITVEPDSANVTLTLMEQTAEREIAPVVVKFAVAADLWGEFVPELKDPSGQIQQITVAGPPDSLAQLSPQDVLGIIEVTRDDVSVTGEYSLKRPEFILPPGVRLKGDVAEVEFRLISIVK